MAIFPSRPMLFFPLSGPPETARQAGFRLGNKGTHSSRTLMLSELSTVLSSAPSDSDREGYARAIIEENCLGKPTVSTRRLSNQRIGELYSFDQTCAVFRVLRRLWFLDEKSHPLLALLTALARDPLLMATAKPILAMGDGDEMQRGVMRDALRTVVGDRFNDSILDKIIRNTASSWTKTGHLVGRTFKVRRKVKPTAVSISFALYLGRKSGFMGEELFSSGWIATLDCSPSEARSLSNEAKRIGLIDQRSAGDVLELDVERLDPSPGLSKRR